MIDNVKLILTNKMEQTNKKENEKVSPSALWCDIDHQEGSYEQFNN